MKASEMCPLDWSVGDQKESIQVKSTVFLKIVWRGLRTDGFSSPFRIILLSILFRILELNGPEVKTKFLNRKQKRLWKRACSESILMEQNCQTIFLTFGGFVSTNHFDQEDIPELNHALVFSFTQYLRYSCYSILVLVLKVLLKKHFVSPHANRWEWKRFFSYNSGSFWPFLK